MNSKVLIGIVLVSAIAGCGKSNDGHDVARALVAKEDVVLVEVDGDPVTLPMLEFLMDVRGVEEDDSEGMRELLDELIRLRAVANRSARDNVSTRQRVRAERMVKDIELQYVRYLEHFQKENPVTEAEIREVYQAQVDRAGERRYKLETIEFKNQAEALSQLEALRNAETDFQAALKQAESEGRVARRTDWVDASQVPADFARELARIDAASVVDSLLPFQDQWLIVRVIEVDALDPPALDEVRKGIRRMLVRKQTEAMIDQTYDAAEITPMLPVEEAPAEVP